MLVQPVVRGRTSLASVVVLADERARCTVENSRVVVRTRLRIFLSNTSRGDRILRLSLGAFYDVGRDLIFAVSI